MISLPQLDRTIFVWINTGWSNSVFDVIMPWISRLADAATIWLWIVFICLLMGWQITHLAKAGQGRGHHRATMRAIGLFCLYMVLIYGVNAGVFNGLKHLFHRSRPFLQQTVILRVSTTTASSLGNDSSFPSGHAGNAFMVVALLAERLRRKRYIFYGLAALVALSRIYLGVHYASDVIVGACLGLAITWFMLFFPPLRSRMMGEDLLLYQTDV
jgi:undecaprenyl-diphosphatase